MPIVVKMEKMPLKKSSAWMTDSPGLNRRFKLLFALG